MNTLVAPAARRDLFGVPIDAVTLDQALELVDEAILTRSRLRVGVVNAAKLVHMRSDPTLRADVLSSDLILADGVSVVWASRLLGCPLPERVAGIDLMLAMLRRANERGYRVYCLGASEAVLSAAVARIAAEYPHVALVGCHHGYFTAQEEATIAADIVAAEPDILLAGISSPKKERFLASWHHELGIPVHHGVGGSFDVLAGKVRRAPLSWQRLGLEWLYRVKQEPHRLWRRYLVTNTLFCVMVIAAFIRALPSRLTATAPRRSA